MNSIKNITYILAGTVAMSGILVSCSVQKYQQPDLNIPDHFRSNSTEQIDTINIAKISYSDFFKDPVLISLIDQAMQQNNDLKVAIKQIEYASLGFKQSKWGYAPKIDATIGSVNLSRLSDNSVNGSMIDDSSSDKVTREYNTSISLSWEADIWGKIKKTKEQELSNYLQSQEATKAVRTRLVSEIVQGYYNLLMLDKQLDIIKENLVLSDNTLVILRKQHELGMINSVVVGQQEIVKEQIIKSIPQIESMIGIQENALSILTGKMPDRIERKSSLDNIQTPESISTGVPSEMLSYRPDVKSSELNLRKSLAMIHIAKVSMYPALNITAQGGFNSLKSSDWFNIPGSLFGIATGTIVQPILNGRQLKTKYEQSKIESEQAEINFKQVVLNAVGEVSDALLQIEKLEEQKIVAEKLVVKANDVVNQSLTLYQYDEATYLEVILAQSNKLQAELDLANIKTSKLNAITTLYRSLGGGWQQ